MCFLFIWQNILVMEERRWMWLVLLKYVVQTALPSFQNRLVPLAWILETLPTIPQQGKKFPFRKKKSPQKNKLKFKSQWKMRTIYFKTYFQKKRNFLWVVNMRAWKPVKGNDISCTDWQMKFIRQPLSSQINYTQCSIPRETWKYRHWCFWGF